jgi:hypothetical protein
MSKKIIKIEDRARAKQINDFGGMLRMRGIYPTDIDGLIDYGGTSFVYLEGKTEGAPIKKGQQMALENLVDSHNKAGHTASALIFRHNTPVEQDIKVSDCRVETLYFRGKWHPQEKQITVLGFIEKWEKTML